MLTLDPLLPCAPQCLDLYRHYYAPLESDFLHGKYYPAVIRLDDFKDMDDYISKISYNKRYGLKQGLKKGFYVDRFNWQSFIGDVVEINTSKEVRAGGKMRASYLETVEQRGGYLKEWKEAPVILCLNHCNPDFGLFRDEPGYKQGDVVTNKRLYAYIGLIVLGEYAIYSMILGHGDYLKDEIMTVLHIGVVKWIKENTKAKYLEYHTYVSGNQGLQDWKRYFLFKPEQCQWKYKQNEL